MDYKKPISGSLEKPELKKDKADLSAGTISTSWNGPLEHKIVETKLPKEGLPTEVAALNPVKKKSPLGTTLSETVHCSILT
jgi:hypothetical protein